MQSMTFEQLRAAHGAGRVAGVALKGKSGAFLVQIAIRSGGDAVLAMERSAQPLHFDTPLAAWNVLRENGIAVDQFDASEVDPSATALDAMRAMPQQTAHHQWLAEEMNASLEDARPNIPHDEVMAEMDAVLAGARVHTRA